MPWKRQVTQGMKREVILENALNPPPFLFTSWFSSACHSDHVSTAKELLWEANHKTNRCREHADAAAMFEKKKKKKLQVSHLMSTTKSWGGRKCCKNKSDWTSTYPYSGLLVCWFFSQHTFHAGSLCLCVCVCMYVCICLLVFLIYLPPPYFSLVSLMKGLLLKDRIYLLSLF